MSIGTLESEIKEVVSPVIIPQSSGLTDEEELFELNGLTQEYDIEGLGKILRADSTFDKALFLLREQGIKRPLGIRDLGFSRIKTGILSSLSLCPSFTREGFLYAKDRPVLIVPYSPLLKPEYAIAATENCRVGGYSSTIDTKLYEKAFARAELDKNKDPKKRRVLILPSRKNFLISRKENWEILEGLLKDQTEDYFKFNGDEDIYVSFVNKETVDNQNGTLMTQMFFMNVYCKSEIVGYSRDFHNNCTFRGCTKNPVAPEIKVFDTYV